MTRHNTELVDTAWLGLARRNTELITRSLDALANIIERCLAVYARPSMATHALVIDSCFVITHRAMTSASKYARDIDFPRVLLKILGRIEIAMAQAIVCNVVYERNMPVSIVFIKCLNDAYQFDSSMDDKELLAKLKNAYHHVFDNMPAVDVVFRSHAQMRKDRSKPARDRKPPNRLPKLCANDMSGFIYETQVMKTTDEETNALLRALRDCFDEHRRNPIWIDVDMLNATYRIDKMWHMWPSADPVSVSTTVAYYYLPDTEDTTSCVRLRHEHRGAETAEARLSTHRVRCNFSVLRSRWIFFDVMAWLLRTVVEAASPTSLYFMLPS
jgi:hypothetical protein